MGKFFDNGEIWGSMNQNGYGSYIITAENRNGDTIEIHSHDSMLFDDLDSEDLDKQEEAVESLFRLIESANDYWKYKARIKSYPTCIELYIGEDSWHIGTDFQNAEFFDDEEDAREWAEEKVTELTKNYYEISNYDELIDDMVSAIVSYIK